jgi:hypothetical protein
MTHRARVTVGIPTFNRRGYLSEALNSVMAQTFCDFEVLVSDNGSTDGTRELVAEFARADPRIRYHRFPANRGLATNFNLVLSEPQTEFIALLPDDDLWLPHHLASAMKAFNSAPAATLYGCTAEFFGSMAVSRVHRPYWAANGHRRVLQTSSDFSPFLRENPVAPVSVVFRAGARPTIRWALDDTFAPMDWLLWGQIAMTGATIFDPSVGVRLRWHQGNQSHSILTGRRANVQCRYVVRRLATLAFERGALTPEGLVREVLTSWPVGGAANLVMALAVRDTPRPLRRAALEIFESMPGLKTSIEESTKHCRMAGRVGNWYLGWADIIDRGLVRWWRPSAETARPDQPPIPVH